MKTLWLLLLLPGCLDLDSLGHEHDFGVGDEPDLATPTTPAHTLAWTQSSLGTAPGIFTALAIDATSTIVYAGSAAGGVYKSTDGATTWTAAWTGLGNLNIESLATDPVTTGIVYAGTPSGVYKTVDGAAHWTLSNTGMGAASVTGLAIDSAAPLTVYAAASTGIFKSVDGGATWAKQTITGSPQSVSIDHSTPDKLIAGTIGSGVAVSADGGVTWTNGNLGLTNLHTQATATNSGVWFVATTTALYRSVGLGWTAVGPTASFVSLAIDRTRPLLVYAGDTAGAIHRSIDGGLTWATPPVTLNVNAGVNAIAIGGGSVYLADVGVQRSVNNGNVWTGASTGLDNSSVLGLTVDPSSHLNVFAGTSLGGGVFRSIDGAVSWQAINSGVGSGISVNAVAVDPLTSTNIFIGTVKGGFKSTTRGSGFILMPLPVTSVQAIAVDPAAPAYVYAGTATLGVYKSSDGGNTWTSGDANIVSVKAIAVDHANGDVFVAADGAGADGGTTGGVFRSDDHGVSWTQINDGFTSQLVEALAVDPSTSGIVYAGTSGGGVFRTTNAGQTWTPINVGLSNTDVTSLAVVPFAAAVLYAGTHGAGVFQSLDSGAHWTRTVAGLTVQDIRALAVSSTGAVFAGTNGAGVFIGQ